MKTITKGMNSAVNSYLMAKAIAETLKPAVDAAYKHALDKFPLYNDLEVERGAKRERITNIDMAYLSKNEHFFNNILDMVNKELRANGTKPADMKDEYCPYLIYKDLQNQAEHILIDEVGKFLGYKNMNRKLAGSGKREQFLELSLKLVISSPDYIKPDLN